MTDEYGQGILDLDGNSKKNDPVSSYTAGRDFVKSGAAKNHHELILAVVDRIPKTNMEIAHKAGLSQNQVTRRVTELERRGLIRRTKDLKRCPFLKRDVTAWVLCDGESAWAHEWGNDNG